MGEGGSSLPYSLPFTQNILTQSILEISWPCKPFRFGCLDEKKMVPLLLRALWNIGPKTAHGREGKKIVILNPAFVCYVYCYVFSTILWTYSSIRHTLPTETLYVGMFALSFCYFALLMDSLSLFFFEY